MLSTGYVGAGDGVACLDFFGAGLAPSRELQSQN
jgi:hypothetical protein